MALRFRRREARDLTHYQSTFYPLLYGVAIAALITIFLLKETGPAARVRKAKAKAV